MTSSDDSSKPIQPKTTTKAPTAKALSPKEAIAKATSTKKVVEASAKTAKPKTTKVATTKPASDDKSVKAPPAKTTKAGAKAIAKPSASKAAAIPQPVENNEPTKTEAAPTVIEQPPIAKTTAKIRKPKLHRPQTSSKLIQYARLMRLDKPIGILLLLWPTLWSLWLAAKGMPRWDLLVIFSLGVVIMRSAGCVINDFADRHIDGKVKRTKDRPLASGAVSSREALILFIALCLAAFGLVLLTDPLTIKLSVGGLILAVSYPFMKRHTHLPQVVLGAAFAWGIPMAYAAQAGKLDKNMWLIYLTVVLWTVVYDTFYAMVDRDDDLKIGVKSTAILFGDQDRVITGTLQIMTLFSLVLVGKAFELSAVFYASLIVVVALFAYQQWLIRYRERNACFTAFLNNNWVGAVIFGGIFLNMALKH